MYNHADNDLLAKSRFSLCHFLRVSLSFLIYFSSIRYTPDQSSGGGALR